MQKKQFKAESKRLLDLMINSIYTNKEIFLREIISNASDAIDKLYYKGLTEGISGMDRGDFIIRITPNKEDRTLTISDNGVGMSKEELENNLGTIAKSGSLDFKAENESKEDIDIIGQFGVGFYSAFMVASKIKVVSRAYKSDAAYAWESDGADGYTISECEKETNGTDVILTLKEDTEDEKYSEYLNEFTIKSLVEHYSNYIRYPIVMNMEKHREKEATEEEKAAEDYKPEWESYYEDTTLNSMVPIWKKSKSQVSREEYNEFYKAKYFDWEDPLKVIHANIEGGLNYNALMFIPSRVPYNFYTKGYEKGLQLYSSGVLIMDKCADLLPDYFSFVRGLVDTPDLSLNISREMLQHDRQLKAIAVRIENKIKSELEQMLLNDRQEYEKFFKSFGLQLKYGIYSDYGANKDKLKDLVMFYSSTEKKLVTLSEYVSRMKEEQKYIYYACGESVEKLEKMPQTEALVEKGYEILFMTDDIDDFAIKTLANYDEKEFRSVTEKDLEIEKTEEEKKAESEKAEQCKGLLEKVKEALDGKVSEVRLSSRLKKHAVCFASEGHISLEMEKVLNQMPTGEKVRAERVLELNPEHSVFKAMENAFKQNPEDEKIKEYAKLLYDMASLMEGMTVDDPVAFTESVCRLMV